MNKPRKATKSADVLPIAVPENRLLKKGDVFTIAGVGPNKDGDLVFNGYTKYGKKSKAVKLQKWVAK